MTSSLENPEGDIWQTAYVSEATVDLGSLSDLSILRKAELRNAQAGITGFLFRTDTHFIQVLEGPKAHVERLMRSIAKDHRHKGLLVLGEQSRSTPMFGQWSMGYLELSEAEFQALCGHETLHQLENNAALLFHRLRQKVSESEKTPSRRLGEQG